MRIETIRNGKCSCAPLHKYHALWVCIRYHGLGTWSCLAVDTCALQSSCSDILTVRTLTKYRCDDEATVAQMVWFGLQTIKSIFTGRLWGFSIANWHIVDAKNEKDNGTVDGNAVLPWSDGIEMSISLWYADVCGCTPAISSTGC